jgi:hypothetical protein
VITSPVRAPTQVTAGAACVSLAATAPSSSSIGSIRAEWNAWLTRNRRTRRPSSRHSSTTASTAASSPEITTDDGPFTAATDTPDASSNVARISASPASIAAIAPPSGSACINRPRIATSRQASSRVRTPAA